MPDLITPSDVASTQLGVFEATGNNDGVPAERYNRGDKVAWCASFVMYCFDMSDYPDIYDTTRDYYDMRRVVNFEREMQSRGAWYGYQMWHYVTPDDIVFYSNRRGSDPGIGRHVGLVVGVGIDTDGETIIETIEGNYGDKVSRRMLKATDPSITGFGRWQPGFSE